MFEDDVLLDADTDTQCILDAAEASARAHRATFVDLGQSHASLGGALEIVWHCQLLAKGQPWCRNLQVSGETFARGCILWSVRTLRLNPGASRDV